MSQLYQNFVHVACVLACSSLTLFTSCLWMTSCFQFSYGVNVDMNVYIVVTRRMRAQPGQRAMTRVRLCRHDATFPASTKWTMTIQRRGRHRGWPAAAPGVPDTAWTHPRGPARRRSWRSTRPDAVRHGSERRSTRRRRLTRDSPRLRTW